jgi:sensor histidine kinase YesM
MQDLIAFLARSFHTNRDYRFWAFQFAGWAGYSLVTFLSVTLANSEVSLTQIGHIALQAVLGILVSWLLRPIYRLTFQYSIVLRTLVALLSVVFFSGVWTAARIYTIGLISGEAYLWTDFHFWYFGSLFVFLSWTVLYYGIHYYELLILEHEKLLSESALKEREKLKRVRAESLAREAQLKMLRYQLNPHFLFNTMNAINALVRLGENHQAGEMIQLLSRFLRHTLEQENFDDVTLEQELESLQLYLDIEKARFQERLQLSFAIEPAARQARLPSLILQPIVENSMEYAIAAREEGGSVEIRAQVQNDQLQLLVTDSGPGMKDPDAELGRSIGIPNTLERLETLYGDAYTFSARNRSPNGLEVAISVPYRAAPGLPVTGGPS